MTQAKPFSNRLSAKRILISIILLTVAGYLLARNWHIVTTSAQAARQASVVWLVAALCLTALTYCIAAAVYKLLAVHPLRYGQTVLVEVAASFANRLLPAGLGGLGLHGLYLYKCKHTPAQATAVVSVNNLLGMAAHLSLLTLALIGSPKILQKFTAHYSNIHGKYAIWGVLILASVLLVPKVRRALIKFAKNLLGSLRKLRATSVCTAFCLAALLTTTYTLILVSVVHALGLQVSILQVFIVFSIGMLAGTATPTPGGLVGMEAGLYAGLVGYNVSTADAGAAVLLYRLLTYWLPLVPGCIALLLARRRHFV